jgi:hypothetical protein
LVTRALQWWAFIDREAFWLPEAQFKLPSPFISADLTAGDAGDGAASPATPPANERTMPGMARPLALAEQHSLHRTDSFVRNRTPENRSLMESRG